MTLCHSKQFQSTVATSQFKMCYLLILKLNLLFSIIKVKSAWVEIPQVSEQNQKSQFVFGSPKVSFADPKFPTTTPRSYKMLMSTAGTFPILTTTLRSGTNYSDLAERVEDSMLPPPQEEIIISDEIDQAETINESESNDEIPNNYSGFLPFLKNIQQTLTMNAKKSLKSKISLLTDLRDNLLANIDERMGNLWQSDSLPEARGHHDDHEMEFPSHEGALLTIGFLTFAVFLIKLVLKLIHTLKNKYSNGTVVTGITAMGGMTTATAFVGRKKREIEDYDNLRIMQLIDEYKFS